MLDFICCEEDAAEAPWWCGKAFRKVCLPGREWPMMGGARLGAPGAGATVMTTELRLALINALLLPGVVDSRLRGRGLGEAGWE